MINIICFSKDRPLQLDAYIKSIGIHVMCDYTLHVLYTTSSKEFDETYNKLIHKYEGTVTFMKETNMNEQLSSLIDSCGEYIMFGCDDVIFVSDVDDSYKDFLSDKRVMCFSLRLGNNITYSHPANKNEQYAGQVIDDKYLFWNWVENRNNVDFGYPFELNATIYNKEDVVKYLNMIKGQKWHPNLIEGRFYTGPSNQFIDKPYMVSYKQSKVYVITINRVQNIAPNRVYDEHSTEKLLGLFNEGKKIDIRHYEGVVYDRVHIGDFNII